jgi:VanZ family protein
MDPAPRASPLARYLFLAYVLLVVYATLYPFSGWRDSGISAFAYLAASRPRYISGFDLAVNVLGYVPYGWLAVLALHPGVRGAAAFAAALASGTVLALMLEATQTFLPTRFASNVDVACNLAGTVLGALLGMRSVGWLLGQGPLLRWRARDVLPGARADAGLVLLALWLATQLNPASLLFGAGDLRDLFRQPAGSAYEADVFVAIEALTAACNLVAVGLTASAILAPGAPLMRTLAGLIGLGLLVRAGAFAILRQAEDVLLWLTPGALIGLAVGLPVLFAAATLPRVVRLALAAVLLMGATVLVNLAPANPYFASTLAVWGQGHFLNFNGLTRLLSSLWPFGALLYLMLLAARQGDEGARG